MRHDLVVIGGGPGGLMAARTAAEAGLKVVLVERKKDPTEVSRSCAQILYVRPISPLQGGKTYMEQVSVEVLADSTRFHLHGPGCSVEYAGQLRPYLNWIQISPGGNVVHRWKPNDKIWAFFYQKDVFLSGLLNSALKAGVQVMTETRGLGAENVAGGVRVKVQSKAGEETLEARYAIAADGVSSTIVESLGLNARRKLLGPNTGGITYIMEGVQSEYPDSSLLSFTIPSVNPSNNVMIGLRENNCNSLGAGPSATRYEQIVRHPRIAAMVARARLVRTLAFAADIRTPIAEPVAGNVVIIGDAAAPVETWIQGAVACAYQAVKAILKESKGEQGFPDYVKWWQGAFSFNTPTYFKVVSDYYAWNKVCTDEEVDYIFSLFRDRVGIPVLLLQEYMDVIKRDRPALYEKLTKGREASMWRG